MTVNPPNPPQLAGLAGSVLRVCWRIRAATVRERTFGEGAGSPRLFINFLEPRMVMRFSSRSDRLAIAQQFTAGNRGSTTLCGRESRRDDWTKSAVPNGTVLGWLVADPRSQHSKCWAIIKRSLRDRTASAFLILRNFVNNPGLSARLGQATHSWDTTGRPGNVQLSLNPDLPSWYPLCFQMKM